MSSQYAHQNYVHIDTPSTKHQNDDALEAATHVVDILQINLDKQIRWAFRGCIAYKCHVNDAAYERYTDDIDIIVDSEDFWPVDAIEDALIQADHKHFRKALSPSKLLKVHYQCDDGHLVRLDIYNSAMHSTGEGSYHNFTIEYRDLPTNQGIIRVPVLPLATLVDMKLVAYLERAQNKDFEDIFFALWTQSLDSEVDLPWYRHCVSTPQAVPVASQLETRAEEQLVALALKPQPNAFNDGLRVVQRMEVPSLGLSSA